MVVDRKKQKALALLYLASGPLPNAANSSDVPTKFAGGDKLSIPYTVPLMPALRIDWFLFFFCYSYGSQLFGLSKSFCFAAEHNKEKSSKANSVT